MLALYKAVEECQVYLLYGSCGGNPVLVLYKAVGECHVYLLYGTGRGMLC